MLVDWTHFPSAHSKNDEICRALAPTRNKHPLFDFLQIWVTTDGIRKEFAVQP
jgi:hypothetical protein